MVVRSMLSKAGKRAGGQAGSRPSGTAIAAPESMVSDAQRLALLDSFENAGIGWFWATDRSGRLIYLSRAAARQLGSGDNVSGDNVTGGGVIGRPLADLMETADKDGDPGGERPLNFLLGLRHPFRDVVARLRSGDGDMWWSMSGHPEIDADGEFSGFRGSAIDITEQFIQQRDENRMALFDTLTGLANRHRMDMRLETILSGFRAARRSCALLMLDLDRFKHVNDTLGHPAGDELLRQVAERLQRIVAAPAEIGRLGGDEFQIIIPDMDDRGRLGEIGAKIIQMISQPYALHKDRAIIGASIGMAIAPYDGVTPDELVKSADLALYASKRDGRGQYRFYASDLGEAARRQRDIGDRLGEALEAGQLAMHYQPIVRAEGNEVTAFEALMRWNDPVMGAVSPATFLRAAEELGLAARLGEWGLRRACSDACAWPGNIGVSVNISAQEFLGGGLPETVARALRDSGLDPGRLELEITESVFLGDNALVDRTFAQLKRLGVRLSLDDFGTGHGSLAYLRRAPFDRIKIDQSFVRDSCGPGSFHAAIITAIVSLAGALGLEATAEGVEAMDELEVVRQRGVTHIQGFIFSRPVPQAVVLDKLAAGDFVYEPMGPVTHRAERRTVLRRIGVIHEDHRYQAVLRNISRTGALIEGLLDVPVGTELVLDLGGGQLAVATVRRSQDATQGVEFETGLISDGANGLCTRHRISPYQLAAAGLPLAPLDAKSGARIPRSPASRARFMQLDVDHGSQRAS